MDRIATYIAGSDPDTLQFRYSLQSDDLSAGLDYVDSNALTLNGATIRDLAGNDADAQLPQPGQSGSLADTRDIVIQPAILSVANLAEVFGKNQSVMVNVSLDAPDLQELSFSIHYDDKVDYVENGEIIRTRISGGALNIVHDAQNKILFLSIDGFNGETNIDGGDGVIFSLQFRVTGGVVNSGIAVLNIEEIGDNNVSAVSTAGNPVSLFLENGSITVDGDGPIILETSIDYNTGDLIISFDENIDEANVDLTKFHINNTAGDNDLTLSSSENSLVNGTLTLTEAQRSAAIEFSSHPSPFGDGAAVLLELDPGAVMDNLGNTNAAVSETAQETPDTTIPSILDVSADSGSTPDGTYGPGDIDILVHFSEFVEVDTSLGVPTLDLESGDQDSFAEYVDGSGTDILIFRYSIKSGDQSNDLNYLGSNALNSNRGSIKDFAGNDAILSLPSPGTDGSLSNNSNIVVTSARPCRSHRLDMKPGRITGCKWMYPWMHLISRNCRFRSCMMRMWSI